MLKVNLGACEVKGPKSLLMAELSTLLRCVVKEGIFTNEEIDKCLSDSRMSEEEMQAKLKEISKDPEIERTLGLLELLELISRL